MGALVQVGLTGGIASGKSEVLRVLAAAGCHTLDLDRVAHAVMAPGGSAFDAVVEEFGRGVLDDAGAIDRAALGRIVFADASARSRLNALVHPRVRDEERRRALEVEAPGAVLVTDAALLVETGSHLRFDRLVVVDVSPEQQLLRVMARDGLDESEARRRIAAQMPASEKRRYAHTVLDNTGDLAATRRAARDLGAALLELPRTLRGARVVPEERLSAVLAAGPRDVPLPAGAFLESVVRHGDPELAALADGLRPGSREPWYAPPGSGDPEAALALAAPLAVWALARRGEDSERVAGAAFAVARLFGLDGGAAARLVLTSLAAAGAAARGLAAAWERDAAAWHAQAERWCDSPAAAPEGLRAALAHPTDAASARAAAAGDRSGAVAAGLVALGGGRIDAGRGPDPAARQLWAALRRLP